MSLLYTMCTNYSRNEPPMYYVNPTARAGNAPVKLYNVNEQSDRQGTRGGHGGPHRPQPPRTQAGHHLLLGEHVSG
eukprot:4696677-Prymnesium_polylepis.1